MTETMFCTLVGSSAGIGGTLLGTVLGYWVEGWRENRRERKARRDHFHNLIAACRDKIAAIEHTIFLIQTNDDARFKQAFRDFLFATTILRSDLTLHYGAGYTKAAFGPADALLGSMTDTLPKEHWGDCRELFKGMHEARKAIENIPAPES